MYSFHDIILLIEAGNERVVIELEMRTMDEDMSCMMDWKMQKKRSKLCVNDE